MHEVTLPWTRQRQTPVFSKGKRLLNLVTYFMEHPILTHFHYILYKGVFHKMGDYNFMPELITQAEVSNLSTIPAKRVRYAQSDYRNL